MKRMMMILLILLSCTSIWAGNIYDTSVQAVYETGYSMIQKSEYTGYKIGHMQFDYITDEYSTTRTLYAGNEYIIFAFADKGVKDLDIKVYEDVNGYWTLVKKDTKIDNSAGVSFICGRTKKYKIIIEAYQFKSGYERAYYGLILCWK